jgi:hypothetical protein
MTIYYKKINLDIDHSLFNVEKLKGSKLFEYGNNLGYFSIPAENAINDIFNPLFKIPPVHTWLVQAKGLLIPHVDKGANSCLNYYIRPQNLVTKFWKPIENARREKGIRKNAITNSYEIVELAFVREDLTLMDTFTANENEAYILNIGEVHSVERQDGSTEIGPFSFPRTMIQFQWYLTMDELMEKLGF